MNARGKRLKHTRENHTTTSKWAHKHIPTRAFLLIRNALWADRPRSRGGFFRMKLVARFDLGVACTPTVTLDDGVADADMTPATAATSSFRLLSDCSVPLGVSGGLRCTDGDVRQSSTASWWRRKKL